MSFVNLATPGAVLLAAPELGPQKHLGARPIRRVSTRKPKVGPLLVVVGGNRPLCRGGKVGTWSAREYHPPEFPEFRGLYLLSTHLYPLRRIMNEGQFWPE